MLNIIHSIMRRILLYGNMHKLHSLSFSIILVVFFFFKPKSAWRWNFLYIHINPWMLVCTRNILIWVYCKCITDMYSTRYILIVNPKVDFLTRFKLKLSDSFNNVVQKCLVLCLLAGPPLNSHIIMLFVFTNGQLFGKEKNGDKVCYDSDALDNKRNISVYNIGKLCVSL